MSTIRLTVVKIRQPLTIITWPSRGLRWKTSGSLRYTIWHFPLHAGRICLNHTRGLLIRILAILMKVNGGGVMNSSIAPIGIARRMILAIVTSREVYPGNFKWFHRASNVRSKCFLYRIWAIIFKGFERISCLSQTYQNVNKAYWI